MLDDHLELGRVIDRVDYGIPTRHNAPGFAKRYADGLCIRKTTRLHLKQRRLRREVNDECGRELKKYSVT